MGCTPSQEAASRNPRAFRPGWAPSGSSMSLPKCSSSAASPPVPPQLPISVPASAPVCKNGCAMTIVGGPSAEKHYKCNLCSGKSKLGHQGGCTSKRWRCTKCDYDICFECHPECKPAQSTRKEDSDSVPSVPLQPIPLQEHEQLRWPDRPSHLGHSTTEYVKGAASPHVAEESHRPPVLTAVARPRSKLLDAMPGSNTDEDFMRRCQMALAQSSVATCSTKCPTATNETRWVKDAPSLPASPSHGASSPPTLLQRRSVREPSRKLVPNDVLKPDADYCGAFNAQLERRDTFDVRELLQSRLKAMQADPCLQSVELHEEAVVRHVEPQMVAVEDSSIVDVPELSRAPRGTGAVTCTCAAR